MSSAPPRSAPPSSFWSRSSKLLSLAAGLASKELQGRVERAVSRGEEVAQQLQRARVQIEQARDIAQSLGQLKGAAMKAGQLLSMELRDLLPPEASAILQTLQDSAPAVEWTEIRAILREELGAEALAQLEIDEKPLASASIGQVHRATWSRPGEGPLQIVLKVQFRGIAETIDSDLLLLERIARLFVAVQFKQLDLSAVFAELRAVLVRETDYRLEADSAERYRVLAHRVPGLRVPEVHRALSTARVLALSFEPGLKLDAFLQTGPSAAAREKLGAQLLDLYFHEFFEWGLVQTDANFANFLFRPGGHEGHAEGALMLLDFGATRDYDAAFRERYRALLIAAFRGDFSATLSYAQDLGLIDHREGPESQQNLYDLLRGVLSVFGDAAQPVDFRDRKLVDASGAALRRYYQGLTRSAPPAQLIFLHRKLGGVYALGKALGVRLDLRPFWQRLEGGAAASPPTHRVPAPARPSAEEREGRVVGAADGAGLVAVAQ